MLLGLARVAVAAAAPHLPAFHVQSLLSKEEAAGRLPEKHLLAAVAGSGAADIAAAAVVAQAAAMHPLRPSPCSFGCCCYPQALCLEPCVAAVSANLRDIEAVFGRARAAGDGAAVAAAPDDARAENILVALLLQWWLAAFRALVAPLPAFAGALPATPAVAVVTAAAAGTVGAQNALVIEGRRW